MPDCEMCDYYGKNTGTCDYCIITGQRRGRTKKQGCLVQAPRRPEKLRRGLVSDLDLVDIEPHDYLHER